MKRHLAPNQEKNLIVAPRRGAWIETPVPDLDIARDGSRTPQGCVD